MYVLVFLVLRAVKCRCVVEGVGYLFVWVPEVLANQQADLGTMQLNCPVRVGSLCRCVKLTFVASAASSRVSKSSKRSGNVPSRQSGKLALKPSYFTSRRRICSYLPQYLTSLNSSRFRGCVCAVYCLCPSRCENASERVVAS